MLNELKPDIVSGAILQRLNDDSAFLNVANTDYQGEITNYGQSVTIVEVGAVTISSYTMGSTSDITIEQLPTASKVLQINQSHTYGFTIDKADNAQAKAKVMSDGIRQAAWGFRDTIDAYMAALYSQAGVAAGGTATTGVDITSTNVLVYFMEAARKLDETNTPQAGRWAVVPPWLAHKATLAGIVQKTDNNAVFENGYIGRVYGFDVYSSNNISAISSTDRYPALFGYRGSMSMAVQLVDNAIVEPSKQFVMLAKGLLVYGGKVIRPNNLAVLYADYTEEAT